MSVIESIGINLTLSYPQLFFKNGVTCYFIKLNLYYFQPTVYIFVTTQYKL